MITPDDFAPPGGEKGELPSPPEPLRCRRSTRFKRVVHWFERRHRRFGDHRALFQSGPRYALLAGMIALVPFLIYTFAPDWWLLLVVSVAGASVLSGMVYLFFMIVGSVEHDNEVKARGLAQAYDDLQRYAGRVRQDMHRARAVQQRLLPDLSRMPLPGCLEWAGRFIPEEEVAGDYFDAHPLDEHRVAIIFGDVSGHGMAAAFVTAILKTSFQRWVEDGSDIVAFFHRLNRSLCRLTPEDSFAAVFLAVYDARTMELAYLNGGHHPEPWVVPADAAEPVRSLSDARATLLGVQEGLSARQAVCRLRVGDLLLLATDGIIEAVDAEGRMYSPQRLEALLQRHRGRTAPELVANLVDDLAAFARDVPQADDQTVLALRVLHPLPVSGQPHRPPPPAPYNSADILAGDSRGQPTGQ